jgi:predicted helicase
LLMAPYAVAHLKLGMRLRQTGYDVDASERLRVYLTNSLEEAHERQHGQLTFFSSWLAEEADRASEVKRDLPVMVVLGNPPYSGQSSNKGQWITDLLHGRNEGQQSLTGDYFTVDGAPLGENNPKWLYDDYVKFIRFAQWRIERTGGGVIGFITNHGFLDNPTFRGMRQSLMGVFDSVYVLDLHGNVRKQERCPDGSRDENVFDIPVGVAISLFVRHSAKASPSCDVYHSDLWGLRETVDTESGQAKIGKYPWLLDNCVDSTHWETLSPQSPSYLFIPQDTTWLSEYEESWRVTDVMPVNSNGLITSRDKFVFGFTQDEVAARIRDFRSSPLDVLKARYGLRDVREMSLEESKRLVDAMPDPESLIRPCLYRPFDTRMLFYDKSLVRWPTPQVMKHMLDCRNLALITSRMTKGETFHHVQVSRTIAEVICLSSKTSNNAFVFPLYLEAIEGRGINLHHDFVNELAGRLGMSFDGETGQGDLQTTFGPEDVFHYIYALLHSPSYRLRYSEFLKRDFPRVPMCSNPDLFRQMCGLGHQLVGLHLMEVDLPSIAAYPVTGANRIEKILYVPPSEAKPKGCVWINDTQYFEGVPPEVWDFHVGGYMVCDKWLKSRKGHALTFDDLDHYQNVVAALSETLSLMAAIDDAIDGGGGWPIQ